MVSITILFSTFNGRRTLPRMLDTLEQLQAPGGGWKIVAVDNGSTDDSLAILKERAAKLPMAVVSEPRRGKNVGLNTGLALVEGEIVALTDDDVILPPNWLLAIQDVVAQQPDYDIFGGVIYPVWEEPPPAWVLHGVPKGIFAWTDFQEGPIYPSYVWGPNMSVRTPVLRAHKFFEGIGPNGSSVYAMGSETEFTLRAERSGHRCWHFHSAPVGHIIRSYQLKPEWLLQRAYNLGLGQRRRSGANADAAAPKIFGFPRYLLRQFVDAAHGLAAAQLFGTAQERFAARWRLRYLQGDLAERRANKPPNCPQDTGGVTRNR
jgi:glycosyltransferase involved in cell wall biosynthesis